MKKNIQLIWDFDDTIVQTYVEFEKTNQQAAEIIARDVYGEIRNVQEIKSYQRKIDVEMISSYGFVPERFLIGWLDTYDHFLEENRKVENLSTKDEIQKTVKDVYLRKYHNVPGAISVLKQLKLEGYSSMILTAGVDRIQKRKIVESGANHYVDHVYVYPQKTPDTLKEIIRRHPASDYVMIGNSLKSDIYPALANDVWGFHYEQETWEADHYEIDTKNKKYVSVSSISQIPNELQIHVKIGQSEISQPFKVGSAGLL
ncbi:HAD family hydrolase [Bacillus sp. EB600]|uniref:HAD family hydrolase n=1 Tax=Bacillus sp. EB600 TaxID=2806345 RepID=UPI00210C9CA9|nr:HAD family hydrolase [Bacillus sp. EB600]MCQ6279617.1 HAD family hydrolase [Bacillus sp. EB600]